MTVAELDGIEGEGEGGRGIGAVAIVGGPGNAAFFGHSLTRCPGCRQKKHFRSALAFVHECTPYWLWRVCSTPAEVTPDAKALL